LFLLKKIVTLKVGSAASTGGQGKLYVIYMCYETFISYYYYG